MKQIFCLFFLFLISCKSSNEIKEVEILTYFNNARELKFINQLKKVDLIKLFLEIKKLTT